MSPGWGRWLWGLIAAGILARVVLAFTTTGSQFDLDSYSLAAEQLRATPLDFYAALGGDAFRWPYPSLFLPWVASARELADATGLAFHGLIGLPAIAADAAIAWLVQDFLGRRGARPCTRLAAAGLVALGPVFVVISGYHPQFDSVAILPAVAAVSVWDRRGAGGEHRALLAGVLIGVGCATKTVPILILLALLPTARNRREGAILIAAALAVPLLALAPFLLETPRAVLDTFDYAGVPGVGGLTLALQPEMAERWLTVFHDLNRLNETLVLNRSAWTALTIGGLGLFLFRNRTPALLGAALLWLTVYVTGTGFFFQYLVWGLPFLLMAGHLREVALIQAVVVVPMLLFYNAVWEERLVAVPYAVAMIGLWLGMCAALLRLGRAEAAQAQADGRRRASPVATASAWLGERLAAQVPGAPRAATETGRRSGFAALLVALGLFSVIPLAILLREAMAGETLTGADGRFAADQLQYLAWIRDAAGSVLVENDFALEDSSHVFAHPMVIVSAAVEQLTGSIQLAYLLWKPVAVVALFAGFALYVRKRLTGVAVQLAALALALFFASPLGPLSDWLGADGVSGTALREVTGEGFNASLLFGYLPAALATALMAPFVLGLERVVNRGRSGPGRGSGVWIGLTALAGALASWLHPWQGQVLLVIIAGLALWTPVGMRRRDVVIPALATLAPLVYLFALSELSPAWELARQANEELPQPAAMVALALAPLAIPAVLALREPARGAGERMLRIWPVATLLVHFVLSPTVPAHAFAGVALPLAVLAGRGWQGLRLPRGPANRALATLAVAALTLPGAIWTISILGDLVRARAQPHYLADGERDALEFLRDEPAGGGVLATAYLGSAVPAFAERQTWVGHPSFTPDFLDRAAASEALFAGELTRSDSRRLVAASGASYVLSDCKDRVELGELLGPLVGAERRFGCAKVYELERR